MNTDVSKMKISTWNIDYKSIDFVIYRYFLPKPNGDKIDRRWAGDTCTRIVQMTSFDTRHSSALVSRE